MLVEEAPERSSEDTDDVDSFLDEELEVDDDDDDDDEAHMSRLEAEWLTLQSGSRSCDVSNMRGEPGLDDEVDLWAALWRSRLVSCTKWHRGPYGQ